ncbi:nicotinate phosphoribosyltransferase [Terfezia boudieri ATCC MYA-4762]|uniref:Nicotinate phosphoribosyltransferase n=1 Tax=Terfezia boudieri ATCC MYA-4762 TaxID=1051890 RepID=A0A3N4LK79_9PEZI|nr:nicotinate phosphoribosyltransferase [Terfezia boudieri ATCC MYA-4762]
MPSPQGPDREGIASLLDTDLYKLTMQCAILHSGWGDIDVTYTYTNRTPYLKIRRSGYEWLKRQVSNLGSITVTEGELGFLRRKCPYFPESFLEYLKNFRLKPNQEVKLEFHPVPSPREGDEDEDGNLTVTIAGSWAGTILYEIPLLVLVSESYFRYTDTDWDYTGQEEKAFEKGVRLLQGGCVFSEFGTRRRRSYATQEMVLRGLMKAAEEHKQNNINTGGIFSGTSNVHFAHRFDLNPIGTVAHEWFMGIAAITQNYSTANLVGLEKWLSCFGAVVLGIALTDTFGTEQFLKCFKRERPGTALTYAEIYTGVRQDSGDPKKLVLMMKTFYTDLEKETGRKVGRKTIVFSDSLNVDLCLRYKTFAEEFGFATSFGIDDFERLSCPKQKSSPLNIVIKLSSAAGRPAVKISDNIGKNTGDKKTVEEVKQELGYIEKTWSEEMGGEMGDEKNRWGA